MSKYRKRSELVEAITFDELVQHGIAQEADLIRGMPWHFKYQGHQITHENDACYLVPCVTGGSLKFNRGEMLVTCSDGQLFPMSLASFCMYYERAERATAPPPEQEEGMTIKGDGASELGKLMREQRQGGPVPHA